MNSKLRLSLVATGIAALLAMLVSAAGAAVVVYQTDFSKANHVRKLVPRGDGCSRTYLERVDKYGLDIKKGPRSCRLKLPVYGDRPQPDHEVSVDFKTQRDTPKSVRKKLFVGVYVRVEAGSGYQVRIYPQSERLRITRDPSGGEFPFEKTAPEIAKTGFTNKLEVRIEGDRLKVFINGKRAATLGDDRAGDVEGAGIQLTAGIDGKADKGARVAIDNIKVAVPRI